jgi:hypothetical protein
VRGPFYRRNNDFQQLFCDLDDTVERTAETVAIPAHSKSVTRSHSATRPTPSPWQGSRTPEASRKGCLTPLWFALDERVRIRVYVDGEAKASIDMALPLGHGYGFGGPPEPFGSPKMGRYGGQFNNYRIPYGNGVRVTALPETEVFDGVTGRKAWWTIRGTENLPLLVVGGRRLPQDARLVLHRVERHTAGPLEELALCDVKGAGFINQVAMAVEGAARNGDWTDFGYMEGSVRAYVDGADEPVFLPGVSSV